MINNPKVMRVYEQVREQIARDARQSVPGEYLSSEIQYSRELEVNRLTVRKAVDELIKDGLIYRVAGKGLFVGNLVEAKPCFHLLFSMQYTHEDSDFFQTMMGCIDAANRLEVSYKILSADDTRSRLDMILSEELSRYNAIILSCFDNQDDLSTLKVLRKAKLPIIMVGGNTDGDACVMSDNYNGGYMIGDHLARNGHKQIVYLTTNRPIEGIRQRRDGFLQALNDNKIHLHNEYIISVEDPGLPLLLHQIEHRILPPEADLFINWELPFTALTGYSTIPVLSMLSKLYRRGFRVPDDVSVVGYGNTPYFIPQEIPISAVVTHTFEKGATAVESVFDYLTGKTKQMESKVISVTFINNNSVRQL